MQARSRESFCEEVRIQQISLLRDGWDTVSDNAVRSLVRAHPRLRQMSIFEELASLPKMYDLGPPATPRFVAPFGSRLHYHGNFEWGMTTDSRTGSVKVTATYAPADPRHFIPAKSHFTVSYHIVEHPDWVPFMVFGTNSRVHFDAMPGTDGFLPVVPRGTHEAAKTARG